MGYPKDVCLLSNEDGIAQPRKATKHFSLFSRATSHNIKLNYLVVQKLLPSRWEFSKPESGQAIRTTAPDSSIILASSTMGRTHSSRSFVMMGAISGNLPSSLKSIVHPLSSTRAQRVKKSNYSMQISCIVCGWAPTKNYFSCIPHEHSNVTSENMSPKSHRV
jgi:hypothetical protein